MIPRDKKHTSSLTSGWLRMTRIAALVMTRAGPMVFRSMDVFAVGRKQMQRFRQTFVHLLGAHVCGVVVGAFSGGSQYIDIYQYHTRHDRTPGPHSMDRAERKK